MKRGAKRARMREGRETKPSGPATALNLLEEGKKQSKVHFNVGQDIIAVTEGKARSVLQDLLNAERKRYAWQTPAGMLLTEVAAWVSSGFREAMGISAEQWQALFALCAAITSCWLVITLMARRKGPSLDLAIEMLKSDRPAKLDTQESH
jgi:type II secretory pathway component PulJ